MKNDKKKSTIEDPKLSLWTKNITPQQTRYMLTVFNYIFRLRMFVNLELARLSCWPKK